jgi:hypothetical protein
VKVNKKLADRLKAKKEAAADTAVDPKGKKGAPPPAKEAPKKDAKGKGGSAEDEEAEEARLLAEKEEAEKAKMAAIEANFDRDAELATLGGNVTDFDVEDANRRT